MSRSRSLAKDAHNEIIPHQRDKRQENPSIPEWSIVFWIFQVRSPADFNDKRDIATTADLMASDQSTSSIRREQAFLHQGHRNYSSYPSWAVAFSRTHQHCLNTLRGEGSTPASRLLTKI